MTGEHILRQAGTKTSDRTIFLVHLFNVHSICYRVVFVAAL